MARSPFCTAARLSTFFLALSLACGKPESASDVPRVSRGDVAQLRWIAGDWRGSGTAGTEQAPFFERYVFPDDSTLLVISFPDSTWSASNDSSRYELRDGRFGNTGTMRWAASHVDSVSADFVPVAGARNSFRWEREPGSGQQPPSWRATISSTDSTGARRERHYLMERVVKTH